MEQENKKKSRNERLVLYFIKIEGFWCFWFKLLLSLPGSVATVNAQISTSHEAAGITDQKHTSATELVRQRQATEHVFLGPLLLAVGEVVEQVLQHLGHDVAGREGVDADAVGAPFGGEVASELDDGSFGGIVGTELCWLILRLS
jgi:hypothetical protein